MRNRLTLCGMIFALLLVGKIGHVGTLSAVAWYWIALPLALDILFDFAVAVGWQDYFIQAAIFRMKSKKMDRIVKDAASAFKNG